LRCATVLFFMIMVMPFAKKSFMFFVLFTCSLK
jgi:hypothetical protein